MVSRLQLTTLKQAAAPRGAPPPSRSPPPQHIDSPDHFRSVVGCGRTIFLPLVVSVESFVDNCRQQVNFGGSRFIAWHHIAANRRKTDETRRLRTDWIQFPLRTMHYM